VRNIGLAAANKFSKGSISKAKLEKFSPHWLRHLSASHQDKAGIPVSMIRENHRHQSAQTTQIYIHSEDNARFLEMQKIKMDVLPSPITQDFANKEFTLTIKLSNNSICETHNFKRFLNAVEKMLFKSIIWNRSSDDITIIRELEQQMKFNKKFSFSYNIKGAKDLQRLNLIKSSIAREAEIRLFGCIVDITNNQ
jgi:hypothetical protein